MSINSYKILKFLKILNFFTTYHLAVPGISQKVCVHRLKTTAVLHVSLYVWYVCTIHMQVAMCFKFVCATVHACVFLDIGISQGLLGKRRQAAAKQDDNTTVSSLSYTMYSELHVTYMQKPRYVESSIKNVKKIFRQF